MTHNQPSTSNQPMPDPINKFQHVTEVIVQTSTTLPVGVGGAIFLGYTVDDWIKIAAITVGILNIIWLSTRLLEWGYEKYLNLRYPKNPADKL